MKVQNREMYRVRNVVNGRTVREYLKSFLRNDKSDLRLTVMMVISICEYAKNH